MKQIGGLLLVALLCFNASAKTHRSTTTRHAFVKQQACPATDRHRLPCPGYIIDHITPLACGGQDTPANMQWQTKADAKAKDRWERQGCQH